jgi:GDP-D-mannose dehydratase
MAAVSTLLTGVTGQDGSYLAELLAVAKQRLVGTLHPREDIPPHIAALQQSGRLSLLPCDIRGHRRAPASAA